jgi:hypothetical protein
MFFVHRLHYEMLQNISLTQQLILCVFQLLSKQCHMPESMGNEKIREFNEKCELSVKKQEKQKTTYPFA